MQIERVTDAGVLEAIYRLRVTAWRARVPAFPDIGKWSDEYDADALHWAAFERSELVAAARLSVHDGMKTLCDAEIYSRHLPPDMEGPIAVISRLVVAPAHGKRGLPALLDYTRLDYARRLGCVCVLADAHPSTGRVSELQSLGFDVLGPSGPTSVSAFAVARAARGGGDTALVKWLVPEARPRFMQSTAE